MMACVVVFCTTYALILPVITLDRSYICGMEVHSHCVECRSGPEAGTFLCDPEALGCHAHGQECFDPEGTLLCGLADRILHSHEEMCYGSDGQLLCLLPEIPEHIHTEDCFSGEALICGLLELTEHRHSEDCLDETGTRTCCLPETLTHRHNENCPVLEEPQWICGIPEHIHDDSCVETRQIFGLQAQAEGATLNLNFTSYSEWNPIDFPDGNTYSCQVGDEVTIRVGNTDFGATYYTPDITVADCEILSISAPCDRNHTSHHNNSWYTCGFTHEIVVRITGANANVQCSLPGDEWTQNSVTIATPGGTPTEPPVTEPPVTEPSVTEPSATEPPVTEPEPTEPEIVRPGYPTAVKTGKSQADTLYFFNFEATSAAVNPLAGCVFEIRSSDGTYVRRITSADTLEVELPVDIPVGDYTITQISAPIGYLRDDNYTRSFSIGTSTTLDGQKVFRNNTIGSFLNHSLEDVDASKTAEVENYNNRTYEIILSAAASVRLYEMDPIDVLFVVDQSNSMLFPAGLNSTGKTVRLYSDRGSSNETNMERAGLEKDQVYYIIADPQGTSTVFAIWHNGTSWMYQDASYYAKAYYDNAEGYRQDNELAAFPQANQSFQGTWTANGNNYKANGGDLGYTLGGTLNSYIQNNGSGISSSYKSIEFEIYTAANQYNRLHYLEESITRAVYQLSDANTENTVTLIRFTKEVDETHCLGPLEMTPENANLIVDSVNKIQTDGGTRQDLALAHAHNHLTGNITYKDGSRNDKYTKDLDHTFTFLITDGAPVRSGSDAPSLDSIYDAITTNAANVRKESILVTIGLGMGRVERGKEKLFDIATPTPEDTNDYKKYARLPDDASELTQMLHDLIFSSMTAKPHEAVAGEITDVISDSFYPIAWMPKGSAASSQRQLLYSDNRDWVVLEPGDWIDVNGRYIGPRQTSDAEGQLVQDSNGDLVVRWTDRQLRGNPSWTGRFFVKAKEDFIGGNAIDTNKSAYVAVDDQNNSTTVARIDLPVPTVNVRLLDMNENSSEVTVYLGDTINNPGDSPYDSLRWFYDQTRFSKLIADFPDKGNLDYGPILNAIDPGNDPADGLENTEFYLKYAMGGNLTEEQWTHLLTSEDNTVQIDYIYNNDSSHGPVGYFTFQLTKNGDTANYDSHEATQAGQKVEDYTLHITYTAYELGDASVLDPNLIRPVGNVHNGTGSPGTEVSGQAGSGILEEGYGIVDKDNIHIVNVISGSIQVTKEITPELMSDEDQIYLFTLLREEDGHQQLLEVTIPAGGNSGTVLVENLSRGTYRLFEHTSEVYNLRSIKIGESTNCWTEIQDTAAVFHLGQDPENKNVIGKWPNARYTSYTGDPNGVYGEALVVNEKTVFYGEIPVEKIWSDGPEQHANTPIYVLLCQTEGPVLDAEGHARVLRLDSTTNWGGTFRVALPDAATDPATLGYYVREVRNISALGGGYSAILENDGVTLLYVQDTAEPEEIIPLGSTHYMVTYSQNTETGGWTVTNNLAMVLPATGGHGTKMYTFSGLLLIAAGLMFGYRHKRRHERRRNF